MRTSRQLRSDALWWMLAGGLTATKLWLTSGQAVFALGFAAHDDRLFLQLAEYIVQGQWLGPYDQLTLAKGPFYSVWIAAMFQLGVPLFFSQQVFYAAACALLTRAWQPGLGSRWTALAVYLLLLWNPMSYDASSMGRVLRQHLYAPLLLLIFAGAIALYFRRGRPGRRPLGWSLLLGFASGAFWLTREEGVWILPSLGLILGAFLFVAWRESRAAFHLALRHLGVAALAAALPLLAVSLLNRAHYGWFGTVEFRSADFAAAYGAMARVRVGPERPFVPVPRGARETMYAVSPAFATLRPHLEGPVGQGWAEASASVTGLPAQELEIAGGWLPWALRDAVAAAGHAPTAADAMAFYRRMAGEINAACDAGRLPAGPRRDGFAPHITTEQWPKIARTFLHFADFVVSFKRFSAHAPPSQGDEGSLALFRDMTGERLSPPAGAAILPGQTTREARRVDWLHGIGRALRKALMGLFAVAQTVMLLRLLQLGWQRSWTFGMTFAVSTWAAGAIYILLTALIEVTSYPILAVSSFAPVYTVVLLFMAAVLVEAAQAWAGARQLSAPTRVSAEPSPATPATQDSIVPAVACGLVALAPFLLWYQAFTQLFWFADDFFLVDQIAMMGVGHWVGVAFAENFVPLFKLLWSAVLFGADGDYRGMLWALWLTHALNTFLLTRVVQAAGLPRFAVWFVPLVFALTPANLESLGWSVQWSAVLATTFLLAGLDLLLRHDTGRPSGWRFWLPLTLCAAASALSFSRGVLAGPVLALGIALPMLDRRDTPALLARWRELLACLVPAVIVAIVIKAGAQGNHQTLSGHWGDVLWFGASYFLFNPGYLLADAGSPTAAWLLSLGALKLGLLAWALCSTAGRMRYLLLLLVAFDLGNALLLGIGRHHTGFLGALSSRYNYSSLITTLPFLALALGALVTRLATTAAWRGRVALAVIMLVIAGQFARVWPRELESFVAWRGRAMRALLQAPATSDETARLPALDFMHVERAKALMRTFNLH